MPDFEHYVNNYAFNSLGINVNFDARTYGRLLTELAEPPADVPVWTPIVSINPAPVMGMSKLVRHLRSIEYHPDDKGGGDYDPATKEIKISAGNSIAAVNQNLLYSTKRWAGHLSGILDNDWKQFTDGRGRRYGLMLGATAALATVGYLLDGVKGAEVAVAVGGGIGVKIDEIAANNTPFNRQCREFSTNPNVLEEYSRIVTYQVID